MPSDASVNDPSWTFRDGLIVAVLAVGTFAGIINIYVLSIVITLVADDFGVSQAVVGQLATTHAVVAAIIGVVAAPLMDRYPRRSLLQFSSFVLVVSTIMTAMAPSVSLLFAIRAMAGIGSAFLFANCFAAVSDAFPDSTKRNRAVGILLSATGISGVVGAPILTQIAAQSSWRWSTAFLVIPLGIVLAGVNLIPQRERPRLGASFVSDYRARYRQVLSSVETTWLLAASAVRNMVWAGSLGYVAAVWMTIFDVSVATVGWIILLFGAVYFVASNVVPWLIARSTARTVFAVGTLLLCASMLGYPLTYHHLIIAVVLFSLLLGIAGACSAVSLNILLQDSLPAARGTVLSLSSSTTELGAAFGAGIGGGVLALWGHEAVIPVLGLFLPLALVFLWFSGRGIAIEELQPSTR